MRLSLEEYAQIKSRQETARAKSLGLSASQIAKNAIYVSDPVIRKFRITEYIQFTLYGRIPSKKNSKRIAWRGRPMLLSSESYIEWEKKQIDAVRGISIPFEGPYKITMRIWYPDNRKSDNSNKWESVADMLVKAEILKDDNWKIIPETILISMGVDSQSPRCEIFIEKKV